jgi:hypothetical protein
MAKETGETHCLFPDSGGYFRRIELSAFRRASTFLVLPLYSASRSLSMRFHRVALLIATSVTLSGALQAQFSVFGAGTQIPVSGDGGDLVVDNDGLAVYDTSMPGLYASSTVTVPEVVFSVDSVRIDGFEHSWAGDLQATLVDPSGVEHLLFLRPGYLNSSGFGTSGNFLPGSYTFVESGGSDLPASSNGLDILPGTYNQTFSSGGAPWASGTNGISNTPLTWISGPAGLWELRIYDWGNGDSGLISGWTLNGNSYVETSGSGFCFGDGTGPACPCGATGAPGEGCMTTSGSGAVLAGSGDGVIGNDSFALFVTGGPANKPGIFFQGGNQIANLVGDGILCSISDKRYPVNALDANGETTRSNFSAFAAPGQTLNYQYWFRDTENSCGGGFNFTGGWTLTWQ